MQQSRQFAFEREHHDDRARAATEKASFTHRIQRTYTNNIMMMNAFLSSLLLLVSPSQAWLQQRQTSKAFLPNGAVHLILRHADKKGNGNGNGGASVETDDPCWQNMLDDDCSMGNIYSSRFVAADWIKSMPCGEGIEVSQPYLVIDLCCVPCKCLGLLITQLRVCHFHPGL